jgi:hypothetical protein
MAVNAIRWVRNDFHKGGPLRKKVRFAAGASVPVKRGEFCAISGGIAAPLAADQAMAGTIVISDVELISGSRAGFYSTIVPMPGDVFEIELAAAGTAALGTAVYYSTSQKVTVTAGSNILGHLVGDDHIPEQDRAPLNSGYDAGVTPATVTRALMSVKGACSYNAALHVA